MKYMSSFQRGAESKGIVFSLIQMSEMAHVKGFLRQWGWGAGQGGMIPASAVTQKVAAASGALARLDTFSPKPEYPPLPIMTQH